MSPSDRRRRRDRSAAAPLVAAIRVIVLSVAANALLGACGSGSSTHASSGKPGGAALATVSATRSPTAAKPLPPPTHTWCRSVIYIGDSTSDGEASAQFVPNRRLRAPAQLFRVGVKTTHMEVSGARSIHETSERNRTPPQLPNSRSRPVLVGAGSSRWAPTKQPMSQPARGLDCGPASLR